MTNNNTHNLLTVDTWTPSCSFLYFCITISHFFTSCITIYHHFFLLCITISPLFFVVYNCISSSSQHNAHGASFLVSCLVGPSFMSFLFFSYVLHLFLLKRSKIATPVDSTFIKSSKTGVRLVKKHQHLSLMMLRIKRC